MRKLGVLYTLSCITFDSKGGQKEGCTFFLLDLLLNLCSVTALPSASKAYTCRLWSQLPSLKASRSLFWFICISKPTKQGLTLCSREWNRVVTANSCLFTQPSLKGFPFFISLFCLLGSPYYELLSKILKWKAFSFIYTIFPWSNFISPSHWEFAFAGHSFPETSPGSNAFATKIYPSKEVILHPSRIPG